MEHLVVKDIAIILARGGSKRLPEKNILDFHGKPMIVWTIQAAIESAKFDQVLVSTDDEEIAEISRNAGASVPFLRQAACDDMASSSEATIGALLQAESFWGMRYESVTQLMANCPLRDAHDIRNAVEAFKKANPPAQISCFKYGWMNPWWAAKLNHEGTPEYLFPEARKARSQDLPPLYCPSGALWIADADALKRERSFYMPGHVMHPLSWLSAMDIDDAEDLEMARASFIMKQAQENLRGQS
jgi:CMP-N-acetylneuraminic acid synthetase